VRILHTSDWHLGRTFHRVDMLPAQERFLAHLAQVADAEAVDVVLVVGDVYDRALPSVDAVQVLNDALDRLAATGATIIVSSGNHDSPRRLGFGANLLARAGVHVRTDPAQLSVPVIVHDAHGPVAFYPIPYLEPALVAGPLGCERSHPAVLAAAMDAVRADLAARPGVRSVVASHAFVTGGTASDSERDLTVGGIGQASMRTFDGPDYVALGHLHGRQQLSERVRYCGSPVALSFSEAGHTKGSWLVELGPAGLEQVRPIDAPVPRQLAILRGYLDDLLGDPSLDHAQDAWCQITLLDPVRPAAPMERLRQRFPHLLELRFDPEAVPGAPEGYAAKLTGHTDLDVCCGFLEHVRGGRAPTPAETTVLQQALESALLSELEAPLAPRDLAPELARDLASDVAPDLAAAPADPAAGRKGA
jgi:DNA repair protein SbcD/Mre11